MSRVTHFFPLIWDSTMLMELDRCEMSFFRKYIQHLNSGHESTDLIAGAALATGCEVARKSYYNEGMGAAVSVVLGQEALREAYGDHTPYRDSIKTVDVMEYALEEYFEEYPMATDKLQPLELTDGSLAIEYRMSKELSITHPVYGVPLTLVGRADMLGSYLGRNVVADEKTTGRAFTKNWADQWNTRGQFSTYPYLLREQNILVRGALIRGIALQKTKITFQEIYSNRSDWQLDVWGLQMEKKILSIREKYIAWSNSGDHPALHFNGVWNEGCFPYMKPCPFTELCRSESAEKFIESEYNQFIWLPNEHRRASLEEYIYDLEN